MTILIFFPPNLIRTCNKLNSFFPITLHVERPKTVGDIYGFNFLKYFPPQGTFRRHLVMVHAGTSMEQYFCRYVAPKKNTTQMMFVTTVPGQQQQVPPHQQVVQEVVVEQQQTTHQVVHQQQVPQQQVQQQQQQQVVVRGSAAKRKMPGGGKGQPGATR